MKILFCLFTVIFSLSAWAKTQKIGLEFMNAPDPQISSPTLTTGLPDGSIICGGNFDSKQMTITVVPQTKTLKASDPEERFLAFIDLSKTGRVKLAYFWATSDAEYEQITKVAASLANGKDAALIKELGSTLKTLQYFGFTDDYVHTEMQHGPHSVTLSCQLKTNRIQ